MNPSVLTPPHHPHPEPPLFMPVNPDHIRAWIDAHHILLSALGVFALSAILLLGGFIAYGILRRTRLTWYVRYFLAVWVCAGSLLLTYQSSKQNFVNWAIQFGSKGTPAWYFASYPAYQDPGGDNCQTLNNLIVAQVNAGNLNAQVYWDIGGQLKCLTDPWNSATVAANWTGSLWVTVGANFFTSHSWAQPQGSGVFGTGYSGTSEGGQSGFSVVACTPGMVTNVPSLCPSQLPTDGQLYCMISCSITFNYAGAGKDTALWWVTLDCAYLQGCRAWTNYFAQELAGIHYSTVENWQNNGVGVDLSLGATQGSSQNGGMDDLMIGAVNSVEAGVQQACTVGALAIRMGNQPASIAGPKEISNLTLSAAQCTLLGQTSVTVTSFTGTSGTLTFTNSGNNKFFAGEIITLSGFTSGNVGLNTQQVSVLAAGLASTTFEATVTGSGYSSGAGAAAQTPVYVNHLAEINGSEVHWVGALHTEYHGGDAVVFGMYTDLGTVTTSNGALGGCAANCMQLTSGDSFRSGISTAGTTVYINNGAVANTISSCQSTTICTLANPPGSLTNATYSFDNIAQAGCSNLNNYTCIYGAQAMKMDGIDDCCTGSTGVHFGTSGIVAFVVNSNTDTIQINNIDSYPTGAPTNIVNDGFNVVIARATAQRLACYWLDRSDNVICDDSGNNSIFFRALIKGPGMQVAGTKFTSSGGCGESAGTNVGGATAGKIVTVGSIGCSTTITMGLINGTAATAPHSWVCKATDKTTLGDANNPTMTGASGTTATLTSNTIVSGDTIEWACTAY